MKRGMLVILILLIATIAYAIPNYPTASLEGPCIARKSAYSCDAATKLANMQCPANYKCKTTSIGWSAEGCAIERACTPPKSGIVGTAIKYPQQQSYPQPPAYYDVGQEPQQTPVPTPEPKFETLTKPAERTAAECTRTTSTINCACGVWRSAEGKCEEQLGDNKASAGEVKKSTGKRFFEPKTILGVNVNGHSFDYGKNIIGWSCSWTSAPTWYTITVEGDLCGNDEAQIAACEKEKPVGCDLGADDQADIDKVIDDCVKEAEKQCKGNAFVKYDKSTSKHVGLRKTKTREYK